MDYDNYNPIPDKVLQPDGSIISIAGATTIAAADADRAAKYVTMQVKAAKFLLSDGSIINGIPICVTTLYDDLIVIDHALWKEGSTIIYSDGAWAIVKNNLTGETAPTENDDETKGYSVNSLWFDLTASPDEIYRCMDATEGHAIWKNTSLEISELGTAALLNSSTDGTLAGNSDTELPTEKAVKTYADTKTTLAAVKADTDVSDAISKKHSQNTDTGTTSATFQIDSGNTGPKVKNNSGVVEVKNAADDAYADFKAKDATFNSVKGDFDEIPKPTSGNLTAAEMKGTFISNYGQGAADNLQQLDPAAEGLSFIAICGTAQSGKYFGFKAGLNDKIYLDGAAGSDNGIVKIASPVIGAKIYFHTFQTGEATYDWAADMIIGPWIPA